MVLYLDVVMALNFLVDFLLLSAVGHMIDAPAGGGRIGLAALLGGVYSGACLLSRFHFLGNLLCRGTMLVCMALIAFGFCQIQGTALFVLLILALEGLALGLGGGLSSLATAAIAVWLIGLLGFWSYTGAGKYVPVALHHRGRTLHITALRDTGNTLTDPITGQRVLVAGAEVAQKLVGLTAEQLRDPVSTVASGSVPGLRLIPYRSVGNPGGLLLTMRLDRVTIGSRQGSGLVAFAPSGLEQKHFQALTGGNL